MKIGQLPNVPVAVQSTGTQKSGPSAGAQEARKTSAAGQQAASVSVSGMAKAMGLVSDAGADSDVDMDKVNSVRTAIENGTYKVDAEAIADKLLSNAQELLRRNPQ